MVLDHDDADPNRDFYADQGLNDEEFKGSANPDSRPMSKGPFSGEGEFNYEQADGRITEEVYRQLNDHGSINPHKIEVTVEDGEVTLMGSVQSMAQKQLAEDIAAGVADVMNVHNHLEVRQSSLDEPSEIE